MPEMALLLCWPPVWEAESLWSGCEWDWVCGHIALRPQPHLVPGLGLPVFLSIPDPASGQSWGVSPCPVLTLGDPVVMEGAIPGLTRPQPPVQGLWGCGVASALSVMPSGLRLVLLAGDVSCLSHGNGGAFLPLPPGVVGFPCALGTHGGQLSPRQWLKVPFCWGEGPASPHHTVLWEWPPLPRPMSPSAPSRACRMDCEGSVLRLPTLGLQQLLSFGGPSDSPPGRCIFPRRLCLSLEPQCAGTLVHTLSPLTIASRPCPPGLYENQCPSSL